MGWLSTQFRLAGGLNEEDPQFTQKPGSAAYLQNYECLPGGGYRRIGGYNRFAGARRTVDEETYTKIAFTNGVLEPPLEIAVQVLPSGNASAILVGFELTAGDWGSGTAEGWFILTGSVQIDVPVAGDTLRGTFSGDTYADVSTDGVVASEIGDTRYEDWVEDTKDYWRGFIDKVGAGSGVAAAGPVQGVFAFEDYIYAWRSKESDTTKIQLYIGVAGTWSPIDPMPYLAFDDGTAELSIGDAVVGGTSGATGTIHEINIAAGNFAGPTYASGRLFLTGVTGTWQNNEEIRVGGVKKALVNGTMTTPAPISGTQLARHRTVTTNFYGASDRLCVYGVDGYNDPYVFDGTYLMYFDNTMTTKPQFIEVHRNHLFLAYPGGSVQNSGTGQPLVWSVRQGAAEIGIGDDPTGMKSNGNNTLAVTAERGVHILTGTSDLDWNMRVIADEAGSIADTLSGVGGQTLFLDTAGVSWLLPAPPTFQDYTTQQISRNIRKTIEEKASHALFALSVPSKGQYRLFFDDKYFVIATFYGNKLVGWSKCLYKHQMTCGCTGTVAGADGVYMGTDDGYVMLCDFDSSFDGQTIQSIVQLPFCYHGYPDRDKRFHKITLEMETPATIDLRVHMDFDYGTGAQTGNFVAATGATGGLWDVSHWEAFFWDSGVLTAPEVNVDGVGRNVGITLYHDTRSAAPFTISAAFLQFSLYGVRR